MRRTHMTKSPHVRAAAPAGPGVPMRTLRDGAFRGLDLFGAPADLAPGFVTRADNLLIVRGRARVRMGMAGLLPAPLPAPLYLLLEYALPDGTPRLLGTAGGRLYSLAPSGSPATVTEILTRTGASLALRSAQARADRLTGPGGASTAFVVDGAGPVIAVDLAANVARTLGGLTGPPVAPQAALTSHLLADLSGASHWSADAAASGANLLPGAARSDVFNDPGWTRFGKDPGMVGDAFNMDDASEGARLTAGYVAVPPYGGDGTRYPSKFLFSLYVDNYSSPYGGNVTLEAHALADATDAPLATLTWGFTPPPQTFATLSHLFDFTSATTDATGATVATVKSLKLTIQGQPQNNNGPARLLINRPSLVPSVVTFSFADGPAGQGARLSVSEPPAPGAPAGSYDVGGAKIVADLGGPTDLSNVQTVTLALQNGASWSGLGFTLELQQSGQTAWLPSGGTVLPLTLSADGAKAYADITALDAPSRRNVQKIRLTFTHNVTVSGGVPLGLGPLIGGGNLSVGYDYAWAYTEIDDQGNVLLTTLLESNGSPYSAAVTAQPDAATGLITLPAQVNPSAAYVAVYRLGGVFPDGAGRLIAFERVGADDPNGSYAAGPYPANPNVRWDRAARLLRDDTPDKALLSQFTVLDAGHDPPPVGAQDVCAWQRRLCLAAGPRLYVSSLSDFDPSAALYFPRADFAGDPNGQIKGFAAGTGDGAPIVRLLAYGTNLVVDKGPSGGVYLGFGYQPSNFALQSYLLRSGVGCVAPGCELIAGNHVWLLGPDGWYQFDADTARPTSEAIEPLLSPALNTFLRGAVPLDPAAYALSRAVWHGRRLWHFAPGAPGDARNTVAHVWDSRQDGWTNLLVPATSGVSLAGSASGGALGDLYLGGYDGQLYRMSGDQDVSAPGAAPRPIPFALTTRAFGREEDGGAREKRPTRLWADVCNYAPNGGIMQTFTVTARCEGQAAYSAPHVLPAPLVAGDGRVTPVRLTLPHWVRGRWAEAGVSGLAAGPLEILALGLDVAEGSLK